MHTNRINSYPEVRVMTLQDQIQREKIVLIHKTKTADKENAEEPGILTQGLLLAHGRQEQEDLCESEATRYKVGSRTTRANRDILSRERERQR